MDHSEIKIEYTKLSQEYESSSLDNSQPVSENKEWSYSLFLDTLINLYMVGATFYLAYTLKNLVVELYNFLYSFASPAVLFSGVVKVTPALFTICLRPEILGSVVIILVCIYIGKEIGNFRVLRILGNVFAYLLNMSMFYIVIVLHYYCIRVFVVYEK